MTNPSPIVSVLVTVFNREAYLKETLLSILESTYSDFEVIVVDDKSTDRSVEVAEQIAAQDSRIRIHINEENLSDYPNRMKAASLAQGRYLKYVDSDDLIYPHSLALMVESMEKYPDAALGLSHSMPEDDSPYPWCLSPEEAYRKHFLGRGCLSCGPSGAIIRRDAFESAGGFNPDWKVISDTELWYRLAARWSVVLLPPSLVWWRRHENQEFTKDDNSDVYLKRGYELTEKVLQNVDCPLSEIEKIHALDRNRQHFARRILSLAIRKIRLKQAYRLYKKSDLKIAQLFKGFHSYY